MDKKIEQIKSTLRLKEIEKINGLLIAHSSDGPFQQFQRK